MTTIKTKNQRARKAAGLSLKGLSKACFIMGIIMLSTIYAQSLFPVVAFEDYEIISATDDEIILNVSLVKLLDETRLSETEIWFGRSEFGRYFQIEGEYIRENNPDYIEGSRPKSYLRQRLGQVAFYDTNDVIKEPIHEVMFILQHSDDNDLEYDSEKPKGNRFYQEGDIRFTVVGPFDVTK